MRASIGWVIHWPWMGGILQGFEKTRWFFGLTTAARRQSEECGISAPMGGAYWAMSSLPLPRRTDLLIWFSAWSKMAIYAPDQSGLSPSTILFPTMTAALSA